MNRHNSDVTSLRKSALHALSDRLLIGDADAVATCVAFVAAESRGLWHGRARAQMSRRLKHCSLTRSQQRQLVEAILERLATGRFSQQFSDQLRLAWRLAPDEARAAAGKCAASPLAHVRRHAEWLLSRPRG